MDKIVLVEPEVPENTGFTARLADNYQAELRLVNPDFNLEEAKKTASNAQQKLRETEIFDEVEKAVEDLDQVVGTKPGKGIPVEKFEPRKNTSIMIGRESSGLTNEELELCDAVVHIDTPGYSSLNQSHATAIILHRFSESETEAITNEQREVLKETLRSEKMIEIVMRASPRKDEFDRIIGELKELTE